MVERTTCLVLLAVYLCGCSFNTATGADQWPLRYSKEGGTYQQLNEEGSGCLSGGTKAWSLASFYSLGSLGLVTLSRVARANTSVDLVDHAACMKAKGYTVHDQGPQKQP